MDERKNRLIELEKSASEFVDTLKRLTSEIDGYRSANNKLDETRAAIVPLIQETSSILTSINELQNEVRELTSNELLEQVSSLSNELANLGARVAQSASDTQAWLSSQQEIIAKLPVHFIETGRKLEDAINEIATDVRKGIANVDFLIASMPAIIKNQETMMQNQNMYAEQLSKQMENNTHHASQMEEHAKQQKYQSLINRLLLAGVGICMVLIIVLR